jgi:dephospho-CoA kinase
VLDRDHAKRVELEARIAKQMPQSEKAAKSDFIIDNNGQQSLIQQVLKIHKDLTTA